MRALHRPLSLVAMVAGVFIAAVAAPERASAQSVPISIRVDATTAVQGYLRVHERVPASAGPLRLVYPKWIPGTHAPEGPIPNVTGLTVSAGGTRLAWQRDPVDLYTFAVNVPPGVASIDVDFTFLGNDLPRFFAGPISTPAILELEWFMVALVPAHDDDATMRIAPAIVLPSATWKYATALETASVNGAEITFKPVTLEMFLDSPLDAGPYERTFDLGVWDGAPVRVAAFADLPSLLDADAGVVTKLRNAFVQMRALYRFRHFDRYTFLVAIADVFGVNGLEHHQSTDITFDNDVFTDAAAFIDQASTLTHEFNHAWNGKYRRPAGLATPNAQVPMVGDLLWVYEGMTSFYGFLQAERAGIYTQQQWLDVAALWYAYADAEGGRLAASLGDTARASSIRRVGRAWASERRSQDYYNEGALVWLEADALIVQQSGGKKSLDDFARAFFGDGANTGAIVKPYTLADLIAAMNAVMPYDWRGFFAARVDAIAPHPPDPFRLGGYRVAFGPTPSPIEKTFNARGKVVNARYSLGLTAKADGTITDVALDSPAGRAGLSPGWKIVAVGGRGFTGAQLDAALTAAQDGSGVTLIVSGDNAFRQLTIDYRGGPRYSYAERIPGTPDLLSVIARPLR